MKQYIVSIEDIFDYQNTHHVPYVGKTMEEAKKYLAEQTAIAVEQTPNWVCEKGDTYTELFLDGEYSCNHWSAVIDEVDIDIT